MKVLCDSPCMMSILTTEKNFVFEKEKVHLNYMKKLFYVEYVRLVVCGSTGIQTQVYWYY